MDKRVKVIGITVICLIFSACFAWNAKGIYDDYFKEPTTIKGKVIDKDKKESMGSEEPSEGSVKEEKPNYNVVETGEGEMYIYIPNEVAADKKNITHFYVPDQVVIYDKAEKDEREPILSESYYEVTNGNGNELSESYHEGPIEGE